MYDLDALFERLTRLEVIERAAQQGTLHALLSELDWGSSALGADPRADVLRAVRTALRIDLAFLVAHPEDTFSCLHYRLAWHGIPDARAYDAFVAGEKTTSTAVDVAPSVHLLHHALRTWRANKEASGTPWLRTLRPPEIGLHGALVEEYRAEAPEYFRKVQLAEGGRRVDLAYASSPRRPTHTPQRWRCIAWNRATGVRVEPSTLELLDDHVSPDGRYRVEYRGWGVANLFACATDFKIGAFPLSDSCCAGAVAHASDAELVALSGWDDDGGGFVAVYNVKTLAQLMRVRVDSMLFEVAISSRGERVAASGLRETYIWKLQEERPICVLPLRKAKLAFSPDSQLLLTAELGVVRVWDLDRKSTFLHGYRGGLSNAAFSPRGDRLVTGACLVDARDGVPIAHIDFKNVVYWMGGPPRNAFVMADERLVCLERGVEVWDAKTGAKLVRDSSRHYHHGHAIALTQDGTRYAVTFLARHDEDNGHAKVSVIDTDSGEQRCEFTTSRVTCMAWTPDGHALATGSVDGQVRLWDGARGVLLRTFAGPANRVADLAFLRNGAYLVSGADADALRAWRVTTGELVFSRPLEEGDPEVHHWRRDDTGRSYYSWMASDESLDAVNEALDVPEPSGTPPWVMKARAGSLALVDTATGVAVAWFPANERVAAHPSEPIWAGGPIHLRLEGDYQRPEASGGAPSSGRTRGF